MTTPADDQEADRVVADAARQAGLATRGTDQEIADAVRAVGAACRRIAEALRPTLEHLGAVWSEAVRNLAPIVEAYERGELRLQAATDRSCHCLCPMHRDAGMFCTMERAKVITLVGGVDRVGEPVPMCGPCAGWWATARPDRVDKIATDRSC